MTRFFTAYLAFGLSVMFPVLSAKEVPIMIGADLQKAIDSLAEEDVGVLQGGIHILPAPLVLTEAHSGRTLRGQNGAIVSGGKRLVGWQKVDGDRPLWKISIPEVKAGTWYFRQLFSSDLDLRRSRFPADGWLRGETASFVDFPMTRDVAGAKCDEWRRNRLDLYTTLRFKEVDAATFQDSAKWSEQGAEMLLLQSWDASWHPLRSIDSKTRDMRFFTPSRYPMNHWQYSRNKIGAPYRIENVRSAIAKPGDWSLNRNIGELLLLGKDGFDPNKAKVIAPRFDTLMTIQGRVEQGKDDKGQPKTIFHRVKNLRIEGISFQHSTYPVGYYDQHKDDWTDQMRKLDPDFPKDFPGGITDSQAAPRAGHAIGLEHVEELVFSDCRFENLGGWAVHFLRDSHRCHIERSVFRKLGAGALQIDGGSNPGDKQFPSGNRLSHCLIEEGGVVHHATVAIRIANAHENVVEHCEIRKFPYTGISLGWNWSRTPNQCFGNRIAHNDIHHVCSTISDGAAIYTLGILGGTQIHSNYLHDILRAPTAVGAGNTGMLFDQYSLGLHLEGNVVRRVQSYLPEFNRHNEVFRHFRNDPAEHVYEDNDFADDDSEVRLTKTVDLAGPDSELR